MARCDQIRFGRLWLGIVPLGKEFGVFRYDVVS